MHQLQVSSTTPASVITFKLTTQTFHPLSSRFKRCFCYVIVFLLKIWEDEGSPVSEKEPVERCVSVKRGTVVRTELGVEYRTPDRDETDPSLSSFSSMVIVVAIVATRASPICRVARWVLLVRKILNQVLPLTRAIDLICVFVD